MSLKIVTVSDGFGSATVPSVVDPSSDRVQHITVSALNISQGYVTLAFISANPTSSMLSWKGVVQTYGADYDITGVRLNFLPRLLTEMAVGDELVLYYQ